MINTGRSRTVTCLSTYLNFLKRCQPFLQKKQMSPRFSGKSVHLRCYGYEFISLQHLFFHDQSSQMRQEGQGLTGNWSSGQLPVSSRYSLRTVQNNTICHGRLVVSLLIADIVAGAQTLGKTERKAFYNQFYQNGHNF